MYEQLALFPDSDIISPERPAAPAFRIVALHPEPVAVPQAETLPFDEDAA